MSPKMILKVILKMILKVEPLIIGLTSELKDFDEKNIIYGWNF